MTGSPHGECSRSPHLQVERVGRLWYVGPVKQNSSLSATPESPADQKGSSNLKPTAGLTLDPASSWTPKRKQPAVIDRRPKLRKILSPEVGTVIVEPPPSQIRNRYGRLNAPSQRGQTHCHQRPRDSRRPGTGYDRVTCFCARLREALRSQPGRRHCRPAHKTMHKKRNNQESSCPDGYRPAGIVIPLRLTKRQEKYSAGPWESHGPSTTWWPPSSWPETTATVPGHLPWKWKNSSMN